MGGTNPESQIRGIHRVMATILDNKANPLHRLAEHGSFLASFQKSLFRYFSIHTENKRKRKRKQKKKKEKKKKRKKVLGEVRLFMHSSLVHAPQEKRKSAAII